MLGRDKDDAATCDVPSCTVSKASCVVIRACAFAMEKIDWLTQPAALKSLLRYFDDIHHSDVALAPSQVEQHF